MNARFISIVITSLFLLLPFQAAFAEDIVIPKAKPEAYVGAFYHYKATHEDTLLDIARKYDLGYVEMVSANPHLDPWIPGEGESVLIPSLHILPDVPQEGIVINIGDMRLYKFDNAGRFQKSYPIGVGKEGLKTPLGKTYITKKTEGPWWYPTKRMRSEDPSLAAVVKQGKDNPLGSHILYLGWPTYAIHGTNKPWGIGRRVSSGCVRMYPEDIIKLYEGTDVKTSVRVVDQRYKAAWISGGLYLEVHPSKAQAAQLEYEENSLYDFPQGIVEYITEKAGEHSDKIDWVVVRDIILHHTGYPVRIDKGIENQEQDSDKQFLSGIFSTHEEQNRELRESGSSFRFRALGYNE